MAKNGVAGFAYGLRAVSSRPKYNKHHRKNKVPAMLDVRIREAAGLDGSAKLYWPGLLGRF
jgi:hypothetical protein